VKIPSEYAPIILIIVLPVVSLLMGMVGYLLKDIRSSLRENEKDQKQELETLKKDLANFKTQVAHQYVHKDDYIRTIASFDKKMDDVVEKISELNKSVSELLGKEAIK
jgi:uncharacterized membrane-anchored protein YhcB (DUF1043 family)